MSDGRTVEGIAIPYGVAVELRPGLREVFARGAFAESVAAWHARIDGARVPFVSSHPGEGTRRVVGTVEELRDTPEGLRFRARLLETRAAQEYAEEVRAGANGVSVEFDTPTSPRIGRDGLMEHRAARLLAIAGAIAPAYDMARVAVRNRRTGAMADIRPEDEPEGTNDEPTEGTNDEPTEGTEAPEREPAQARSRMSAVAGRVTVSEPERRSREAQAVARVSGAPARITRSELVYTREGEHRFLRDGLRAASGDMEAAGRLHRHYTILEDLARRAAVVTGDVAGTYPTDYMPGLLVERVLKGRPMGGFFRRIPITDARTRTFPRVVTSTTVDKQVTEGVNTNVSQFTTAPVNVTPDMYMGMVDVSRQVIDGGDPDAERMILDDLTEAYAQASEAAIAAGIIAGATAGTHAIDAGDPHDGLVGSIASFAGTRFAPPEGAFLPAAAWEGLVLEKDTAGRPLVPFIGPTNADGTITAAGSSAVVLGIRTDLAWGLAATDAIVARREDAIYYESSLIQFRYEQIGGPSAIRIGVWAYLEAAVRRPLGVVKETVTPAVP